MNRKPSSSLRTYSRFTVVLVLVAGVMNLAGTGVSANEAAKDTTPGDFPDYSNVQGYQLQPGSKILAVNATQILRVVNCAPAALSGLTCKPVPVTGTIDVSDKLVVYTDRANWNPGTYSFVLNVSDPNTELTAKCKSDGGGELQIPFVKTLLIAVGGNCLPDMTPVPVRFTDPAVLQGTFNCPGSDYFMSLDAQWTFTAE